MLSCGRWQEDVGGALEECGLAVQRLPSWEACWEPGSRPFAPLAQYCRLFAAATCLLVSFHLVVLSQLSHWLLPWAGVATGRLVRRKAVVGWGYFEGSHMLHACLTWPCIQDEWVPRDHCCYLHPHLASKRKTIPLFVIYVCTSLRHHSCWTSRVAFVRLYVCIYYIYIYVWPEQPPGDFSLHSLRVVLFFPLPRLPLSLWSRGEQGLLTATCREEQEIAFRSDRVLCHVSMVLVTQVQRRTVRLSESDDEECFLSSLSPFLSGKGLWPCFVEHCAFLVMVSSENFFTFLIFLCVILISSSYSCSCRTHSYFSGVLTIIWTCRISSVVWKSQVARRERLCWEGGKSALPSTIIGASWSFSLFDAKNVPYLLSLCMAGRTASGPCSLWMTKVPTPPFVLPSLVFLITLGAPVHTVHQRKREK